jgi:hypothetical protein
MSHRKVVFVTLLAPKGFDFTNADPSRIVALLADTQTAMRLWCQIIYPTFGVCLKNNPGG